MNTPRDDHALGGAIAAWPFAARAQRIERMRRIGIFINLASDDAEGQSRNAAFLQGLQELGWSVGRNVRIDYRWGANNLDPDRMRKDAADLLALSPDVVVAATAPIAVALRQVSRTVPIAFGGVIDPVGSGLVASLSRPDGNVTGTSAFTVELDAKRMEVLREMVPAARVIGAFVNPTRTDAEAQSRAVEDAARALSWEVRILNAESEADIDAAFASVLEQKISALVVGADPFFNNHRAKIVRLAERHACQRFI